MFVRTFLFSLVAIASLFATPRTIVFDFGGVMIKEPNREAVVHFLRTSFNLSKDEFEKINQEKREVMQSGKTDVEFWIQFGKTRGVTLPSNWAENFKSVVKDAIGVNREMYTLVEQLKEKQISVALLSNIDKRLSKLMQELGLYQPFDPCLLSCEIGAEKPDPRAYEILLKTLHLPAKDVVLVDDRSENIEAAKKLGFDAILFVSQEQFYKELKKRNLI